jgi:hypothetical protein
MIPHTLPGEGGFLATPADSIDWHRIREMGGTTVPGITCLLREAPRRTFRSRGALAPTEESGAATVRPVERSGSPRDAIETDGTARPAARFLGSRLGGGAPGGSGVNDGVFLVRSGPETKKERFFR